jgi:predicted nucleic acid-binding protein
MSGRASERSGRAIFLDTHALLAAINADDEHHAAAVELFDRCVAERQRIVTSDWVLAEFLSAAARPPLRRAAIATVRDLQDSRLTRIEPASRKIWSQAFTLYSERADKQWSLVDCTSIFLCRAMNIQSVATHDRHFVQAGLEILIP